MNQQWSVTVGMPEFRTETDFLKALEKRKCSIDRHARRVVSAIVPFLDTKRRDLKLVVVRVDDLGFPQGTRRDKFLRALSAHRLCVIPLEAGIHFAIKYANTLGEQQGIHAATPPLRDKQLGFAGLFVFKDGISGDCADDCVSLMPEALFLCGVL